MTGASSFRTQQERYCQHHGPFWALIFLNKRVMPETSNFKLQRGNVYDHNRALTWDVNSVDLHL